MGYQRSVVHRPELTWSRGGPARVVPGERDESGGPGAACARLLVRDAVIGQRGSGWEEY